MPHFQRKQQRTDESYHHVTHEDSKEQSIRRADWLMSRSRSGCKVIRVEPGIGGVVGHPGPGGKRLEFRRKVFGT
jgi:hypothetical protein